MKDAYQRLSQEYTDEEIAESFVLPSNLTEEEQKEMHDTVRDLRKNQRATMTQQERVYAALMQLKYQMMDSIEQEYDTEHDFSKYLTRYMAVVKKMPEEMAKDIGMAPQALIDILTNAKEPDQGVFFRLENHSGCLIPALLWWKLTIKKQEHEIIKDKQKRKREYAKVRNSVCVPVIK